MSIIKVMTEKSFSEVVKHAFSHSWRLWLYLFTYVFVMSFLTSFVLFWIILIVYIFALPLNIPGVDSQ